MVYQICGIAHGTSKKSGKDFTVVHYLKPLSDRNGSVGCFGASVFLPSWLNLGDITAGDWCDFGFEPSYDGKSINLASLIKVKEPK